MTSLNLQMFRPGYRRERKASVGSPGVKTFLQKRRMGLDSSPAPSPQGPLSFLTWTPWLPGCAPWVSESLHLITVSIHTHPAIEGLPAPVRQVKLIVNTLSVSLSLIAGERLVCHSRGSASSQQKGGGRFMALEASGGK